MIYYAGNVALILALTFTVLQSFFPLIGYWRHNPYLLALARPSAIAQFIFVLAAFALLIFAFICNDFSISYVAANSHPSLPFMYKLTGAWGAHEGSILLWLVVLSLWCVIFIVTQKNHPDRTLIIALFGLLNFVFLSFLLLTSNPFVLTPIFSSGSDLNPLLQDPGFVSHPPMLYMGYVGFSAAFTITQAALIKGQLNQQWARLTFQFALAAWCFLTLGIALGSWWSYRVLGWGGFWFWDPVENASLLPWLCGTALIHVLILVEKRDVAKSWAALLVLICFALSILGTFLVRSGVLISAHNFASDPTRGLFLLSIFAIVMFAALTLLVARLPHLSKNKITYFICSREVFLLLNSALIIVGMLTILLGTLYPLILDAFNLGNLSVGAPYFNQALAPLILLIIFAMCFAPFSQWRGQAYKALLVGLRNLSICFLLTVLIWVFFTGSLQLLPVMVLTSCLSILYVSYQSRRQSPSMAFAHSGFALFLIGITLTSTLNEERMVRIAPGQEASIGPYQFLFLATESIQGENYRGIRGMFEVIKNKRHIATLYPEKRIYTVREMVMTKVAIHPGIFRDLYMALGEPLDDNNWSVRLYYKPFVRWIWFGALMMIVGGLFTLSPFKRIKKR